MADETNKVVRRVCVTGGGGYIGSWLVKNLLQKGYTVNATLRDPGDEAKSGPLLKLAGAEERLKLFKADLLEEDSFDSAVEACEGVFHVAGPTDFSKDTLDDFVVPAVKGVVNVLETCKRAKSVRRVVFTSSVTAASPLNNKGEFAHSCLDESCWTPTHFLKSHQSKMMMYAVAKTLAEQKAVEYGCDNELEMVTIQPAVVAGPWITATPILTSAQFLLALLGGNDDYYEMLKTLESLLGCMPLVHIDDVCNAHIFLMEHPNVQGRHICSAHSLSMRCLKDLLSQRYVQFKSLIKVDDHDDNMEAYVTSSSKKLQDMGFSYKYGSEQTIDETIECILNNGILKGF